MSDPGLRCRFFEGQADAQPRVGARGPGPRVSVAAPEALAGRGMRRGHVAARRLELGAERGSSAWTETTSILGRCGLIATGSFPLTSPQRRSRTWSANRAAQPFDLVICMEVAEHLPHARGPSLVAELASLGDAVLFSAAVPFQYGTNHVNEQWPEYWSILFRSQGLECFDPLRAELWNDPEVDWWYAQNALMYARQRHGRCCGAARREPSRPTRAVVGASGQPARQPAGPAETIPAARLAGGNAGSAQRRRGEPARRHGCCRSWQHPRVRRRRPALTHGMFFPGPGRRSYQPERQIADLSRTSEAGNCCNWLSRPFEAELGEAALPPGRGGRSASGAVAAEASQARFAAETEARDARRWRDQAQAQAAARLRAEMRLTDVLEGETERRESACATGGRRGRAARRRLSAQAHAATLEARRAELDRQAASIEAVRQSRVWRVGQRAWHVGRRVRSIGAQIAPHVRLPGPIPAIAQPAAAQDGSGGTYRHRGAPPEKPQIKPSSGWWARSTGWRSRRPSARLKRLEVFDAEDYLRRNADVAAAGIDPYAHFIQSGALEGRGSVDRVDLARLMSSLALFDHATRALPPDLARRQRSARPGCGREPYRYIRQHVTATSSWRTLPTTLRLTCGAPASALTCWTKLPT